MSPRSERGLPGVAAGVAVLAMWLCAVAAQAAEVVADEELERLRGQIQDSRERVGEHERKERALLEQLEAADRRVGELRARVRRVRTEARNASQNFERVEAERKSIEARLVATRRAMRARAVALYKAGEAGTLRVLFSSESVPDMLGRASTLRRLLDHDAELIARHRAERLALASAQERSGKAEREQREAERRLASELAGLEKESKSKRRLLASVRGNRTQERALLTELERAARALEDTLENLGGAQPGARGKPLDGAAFAKRRGRLRLPVDAPVALGFGRVVDERFHTATFRKGVEFAEEAGESVRACASGDVRFAGWFRGYGRIVILHHGGEYFTVSGHLDELRVEVGERVEEGQVIGTVGDTGSLAGPSLYFEVRRGSKPLDPADWLGEVQLASP